MTPEEFRQTREQAGFTQSGLATMLGLTREHILRLEGGKTPIKPLHEFALRYVATQT